MVYLTELSTLASFIKLVFLLIVFVLILVVTYYFTRWYARNGAGTRKTRNIEVLESYLLGPGKSISIIRVGEHFLAVSIAKEQVTVLTELSDDELDFTKEIPEAMPFADAFKKVLQQRRENKPDQK